MHDKMHDNNPIDNFQDQMVPTDQYYQCYLPDHVPLQSYKTPETELDGTHQIQDASGLGDEK